MSQHSGAAHPGAVQTISPILAEPLEGRVTSSLAAFEGWLDRYGETSYDFQTFYAGPVGQWAKGFYYKNKKLGMLAVAPIIFCEAFAPSARRFFFIRQRFPIADAHYAMGYARMFRATGDPQIPPASGPLPRGTADDRLSGTLRPGLGISVRLGDDRRHHSAADAAHHDAAIRVRGVCGRARDRRRRQVAVSDALDRRARAAGLPGLRHRQWRRHLFVQHPGARPRDGRQCERVSSVPADEGCPRSQRRPLPECLEGQSALRVERAESRRLLVLLDGRKAQLHRSLSHVLRDEGVGQNRSAHQRRTAAARRSTRVSSTT